MGGMQEYMRLMAPATADPRHGTRLRTPALHQASTSTTFRGVPTPPRDGGSTPCTSVNRFDSTSTVGCFDSHHQMTTRGKVNNTAELSLPPSPPGAGRGANFLH